MKPTLTAVMVLSLAAISTAQAQSGVDEQAVRNPPQAFTAAFNHHDGQQAGTNNGRRHRFQLLTLP